LEDGVLLQTARRLLLSKPIEGREAGPLDLAERTVHLAPVGSGRHQPAADHGAAFGDDALDAGRYARVVAEGARVFERTQVTVLFGDLKELVKLTE
jgi:hypothetical protein